MPAGRTEPRASGSARQVRGRRRAPPWRSPTGAAAPHVRDPTARGWEELTDGVIVRPAARRADVVPVQRPDGRQGHLPGHRAHRPRLPGRLERHARVQRRVGRRVEWVHEQREPMATYLATLQIGRYARAAAAAASALLAGVAPPTRMPAVRAAFADQPRMIAAFSGLFGPYPFDAYTVVVTDDPLEIPLESQTLSTFGPTTSPGPGRPSASSRTSSPTSGSATRYRRVPERHLAARGLRLLRRVAVVRGVRRHDRDEEARHHAPSRVPQDLVLTDPGRPHLRRPRLQAWRADPAHPAPVPWATRSSSSWCARGSTPTASASSRRATSRRRCARDGLDPAPLGPPPLARAGAAAPGRRTDGTPAPASCGRAAHRRRVGVVGSGAQRATPRRPPRPARATDRPRTVTTTPSAVPTVAVNAVVAASRTVHLVVPQDDADQRVPRLVGRLLGAEQHGLPREAGSRRRRSSRARSSSDATTSSTPSGSGRSARRHPDR